MQRIGWIRVLLIGLGVGACSEGVDSAASFTFGPPPTMAGDTTGGASPTTSTSGPDDPTVASGGVSDSATPTTGVEDTTADESTSWAPSTTDPGSSSDGPSGCEPGATRDCYSGPAGTQDVGECASGTETCGADGTWPGTCEGEVLPDVESCDGGDEDCNGSADDGNPGGGAACNTGLDGPCQPGVLTCVGGDLICEGDVAPAANEICGNDIDDDCAGGVDDGCSCDPGNPALDCAANESCFPSESGEAACDGPVGAGTQYSFCGGDSDCAPGYVCVDTGQGSVYCMQWCTSFFDCPLAADDCVSLEPEVSADGQDWGVCYDGLP